MWSQKVTHCQCIIEKSLLSLTSLNFIYIFTVPQSPSSLYVRGTGFLSDWPNLVKKTLVVSLVDPRKGQICWPRHVLHTCFKYN